MERKGKIYIVLTVLVTLFIIVIEYNKPEEINWFPSYASHSKIPFGTYVFHKQMERLFSKEHIIDINRPPYEYLSEHNINGTYFFLNETISFDDAELEKLLSWTAEGNTLAIASQTVPKKLLDTLHLQRSFVNNFDNFDNTFDVKLESEALNHASEYRFEKSIYTYYFNKKDSLKTSVLGTVSNPNATTKKQYVNVIKQSFGAGEIILNLFPQAYTNYFMLKDSNQNYTAGLLSYLNPSKPIYLDNHYKNGKKISMSPLYVFLKAKQLKWAYYIALIAALFYIIFEGKRKQRAVPVVKPLQNQTLAFTRTIANMYYENGKHTDIAKHKVEHFLEYIRNHLHLNTNTIDETFLKHLAARSNNSIEDTQSLFNTIETILTNNTVTTEVLEKLNTSIEKFKSNNTWKSKI